MDYLQQMRMAGTHDPESKHVLENVYGRHAEIKLLFADLVSILDSTYVDVLDDLMLLRRALSGSRIDDARQKISDLYAILDRMVLTKDGCVSLR